MKKERSLVMAGKALVWALRCILAVMFALVVGIAGNLLTPVAAKHSGLLNDLLTSTWLQLALFLLALLLWGGIVLGAAADSAEPRSFHPHWACRRDTQSDS
jgi:hypothetical protein